MVPSFETFNQFDWEKNRFDAVLSFSNESGFFKNPIMSGREGLAHETDALALLKALKVASSANIGR